MNKKRRAMKKKGVANEDFENDEGENNDELDLDHEVGAEGSDSEHQGVRYPVHKAQKDMNKYKWEVGTMYASGEEFKDTVTAYAVQTAKAIRFRKCDLKRVRALYAAKIGDEDTGKLRSMNLTHTCTQAHRAFKKKVEANLKVKIRELISKDKKKWNLTVTKSMARTILPRIRIRLERMSRLAGEWRPYWFVVQKYEVVNGLDKFAVDLDIHECSCRRWQMSGIPCLHQIQRLDLEPFVDGCYKKEAYLRCYESVIHPRPSHRPVKKRRPAAGDEEQSSRTHLSRKGEKQRCSICGSVGHNKSRCPKPIEDLPIPKLAVKRKATSVTQPPSSAQSNNAAQPKRPRGRPKEITKPICSTQHDPQLKKLASPTSLAPPSSSSQPTTRTLPSSQATLATSSSQPVGHFSARISGAPYVFSKKLKLMEKLPPRKWGLL
ncbi:hypothetical protein Ahy_B03g064290 [Arachis hypogaea]|uniref:SWIM-type domain-containing protein n=1 Tax=Arachis hypogaea TaxID=3818 RepID=A0A444ZZA8_ARAHY|nr:hypothetical protein Ahy_B03g064290 [Arachis hypogaea]